LSRNLQQPAEDIEVPAADDVPISVHGAVLVAVAATGGWLCMAISGNGLRPPGESSVDPMGIPTRPTVELEPRPAGEEFDAAGLEDAVTVPPAPAHVPEAFPDRPAPSNRGVGADAPPVMALLGLPVVWRRPPPDTRSQPSSDSNPTFLPLTG
jgi:hypothetical protein